MKSDPLFLALVPAMLSTLIIGSNLGGEVVVGPQTLDSLLCKPPELQTLLNGVNHNCCGICNHGSDSNKAKSLPFIDSNSCKSFQFKRGGHSYPADEGMNDHHILTNFCQAEPSSLLDGVNHFCCGLCHQVAKQMKPTSFLFSFMPPRCKAFGFLSSRKKVLLEDSVCQTESVGWFPQDPQCE